MPAKRNTNRTLLRITAAAAALLLTAALFAGAAAADANDWAGWTTLTSAGGNLNAGTNYYLDDNVKLSADLVIPSGEQITIDLNGHVLKGTGGGSVIVVYSGSNLLLRDSAPQTPHKFTGTLPGKLTWDENENTGTTIYGGVITGGIGTTGIHSNLCGGGVRVANGGQFTMSGGNIVGNTAFYGGGVSVEGRDSEFTMSGGTIVGNVGNTAILTGQPGGGGVHVADSAVFTMSGSAVIKENTAKWGGGVQLSSSGKFIMEGGEISGNKADGGDGGGVNTESGTVFTMSGGIISGNTASSYGGGVRVANGGRFQVSGTAVISGNMKDDKANNVHLVNDNLLFLDGDFTGEVYINSPTGFVGTKFGTTNNASYTGAENFKSDNINPPYIGKISGTNLEWAETTYTITIPADVSITDEAPSAGCEITLEYANLPSGQQIAVNMQSKNGYQLQYATDAGIYRTYQVSLGGNTKSINEKTAPIQIFAVSTPGSATETKTLWLTLTGSKPVYAGTYTDTLTFTAELQSVE